MSHHQSSAKVTRCGWNRSISAAPSAKANLPDGPLRNSRMFQTVTWFGVWPRSPSRKAPPVPPIRWSPGGVPTSRHDPGRLGRSARMEIDPSLRIGYAKYAKYAEMLGLDALASRERVRPQPNLQQKTDEKRWVALGSGVGRRRRRHLLPWARKGWRRNPWIRASSAGWPSHVCVAREPCWSPGLSRSGPAGPAQVWTAELRN
jgi:hypothetical protein